MPKNFIFLALITSINLAPCIASLVREEIPPLFSPAYRLSSDSLIEIRNLVSTVNRENIFGTQQKDKITLIRKTEDNKFIIAFKDIPYSKIQETSKFDGLKKATLKRHRTAKLDFEDLVGFIASNSSENCPGEVDFNFNYTICKNIKNIINEFQTIFNEDPLLYKREIIFTGQRNGGGLALLGALHLYSFLEKEISKPQPHQIKVVGFSMTKVGDEAFIRGIHQKFLQENILDFIQKPFISSSIFSFNALTTQAGLPIEIPTYEYVADCLRERAFDFAFLTLINGGVIFFSTSPMIWDGILKPINTYLSDHRLVLTALAINVGYLELVRHHKSKNYLPSDTTLGKIADYLQKKAVFLDECPLEELGRVPAFSIQRNPLLQRNYKKSPVAKQIDKRWTL